ncbi:uncharacterized protein [Euwallacea fornicatus]|uniref:uncharacterized protein isoform X1 n=1 Tax=Euwallacea fornicatus TaxID=995702 RepID=UPI00338EB9C4
MENPGPSETDNTSAMVDRVAVKPPPFFWTADLKLWFRRLEAQFKLAGVTTDETKFEYVVSVLDNEVMKQVGDLLYNPPAVDMFPAIKNRLITLFSESDEQKFRKLVSHTTLGDRKPSHLLNEMMGLGGASVSKQLLRSIWLQQLPNQIQSILAGSSDPLEQLATRADQIAEILQPGVYQIRQQTETPDLPALVENLRQLTLKVKEIRRDTRARERSQSRRRSRSPDGRQEDAEICWYHRRFKEKATRCTRPCNFKAEN